jgi:ArsR family transcriptional regulator, arsenate/arsenite/antimonite-responsive transcriptional repressor
MPSRHPSQEICVPCGIREDIPEEVRSDLERIGGLEGLCSRLPAPDRLQLMSRVHHALSDPVRLKILHLLRVQPLCVCVIKHCVGIADSKLSYHLNVLKEGGLIEGTQEKNWIIYRLTDTGRSCLGGIPNDM